MRIKNKADFAFVVFVIITCFIILQLAWSLIHQFSDVMWGTDTVSLIEKICWDFLYAHTLGEVLLTVISFLTVAVLITISLKDIYVYSRWNRIVSAQTDAKLTMQWRNKYPLVPIIVVKDSLPSAWTLGLLKPRIVITSSLIELLSKDELEAVLLHEKYHGMHRHPIKKWILRRVGWIMVYIPILKALSNYYTIWIELLADRYAMNQMGDVKPLASALVKMLHNSHINVGAIGVDFANTAINYRLNQILDLDGKNPVSICSKSVFIFSTFVGMFVTFIILNGCLN
jgi:Zn-dependent protease with chaperone function